MSVNLVPHPKWHDELHARILLSRTPVVGIVLHDTAGTGTHRDTVYLQTSPESPKRNVSVDFTVERDGSIWKLNPDLREHACAHAGRATAFKGLRNGAVTRATIGIEICQKVDMSLVPTWPVEQVRAVAALVWWLVNEFGLVTADITTHRQIITDGSRSDPRMPFGGKDGFWFHYWDVQGKGAEYLASLNAPIHHPDNPTIPVPPVQTVVTYTVKPGDSFFSIGRALNVVPSQLAAANEMRIDAAIHPGDVLKVPSKA